MKRGDRIKSKETVVDRTEIIILKRFKHLSKNAIKKLSIENVQWKPPEKKKRGRLRGSWYDDIRKAMAYLNLLKEDALD